MFDRTCQRRKLVFRERWRLVLKANAIFSTAATCVANTAARIRLLAEHLYSLGPQPVWRYIQEIVSGADPVERLERYGALDRDVVRRIGADEMPPKVWPVKKDNK
jgi:hypothetical protein